MPWVRMLVLAVGISMVATFLPGAHVSSVGAAEARVDFTASPSSGPAPLATTFADTSTGDPVGWSWTFGDGAAATEQNPSHTYETPGSYTVSLTITFVDATSASTTKPDLIVVDAAPAPEPGPVASFDVGSALHLAGRPVAFIDRSTGAPTSWAWTFGDGRDSIEQSPSHVYAVAGRYIVTMSASNGIASAPVARAILVIPIWVGRLNLYKWGVFSTQATSTWCVPASAQTMTNIVLHRSVHSTNEQRVWYGVGRRLGRYRYSYPGVDPQGFAGTLNAAGAGPYRVFSGATYQATLHYLVKRMRLTGKPVGLFVGGGSHAWVLNGFPATADPAVTDRYSVTSVSVMGPSWPRQISRYGYFDMAPNTRLSSASFAHVFFPYHDRIRTVWDGRYVVVAP